MALQRAWRARKARREFAALLACQTMDLAVVRKYLGRKKDGWTGIGKMEHWLALILHRVTFPSGENVTVRIQVTFNVRGL